ncbi:hypothetical protein OAG63_01325 [Methylacidiphilales bacterium]|nr:hypothetical protein [Candidatus Methylacidiphilales bacterium]
MKNKLSVGLLTLALSGLAISVASAHPPPMPPHHYHHGYYYGPGFIPSVSFVIADGGSDDSHDVSMVGHVFRKTGDSTYLFTDGTNTFHLYSDDSELPVGPAIVIGGRFDDDSHVDIRKWHYVD